MISRIKSIFSNYTNIIIFLLLLTTFSGALRKWAGLPGIFNNLFLLIIMTVPLYLLFIFKDKESKKLNKTLNNLTQIFIFILLVLAFHPLNHTYFHGFFGFLVNFIFIAILLSYLKNKDNFNDKKIIKFFFFVLVVQLIIATLQYSSPTDSFINRYADNRQEQVEEGQESEEAFVQANAKVGDAVRATGTFSYLGGYSAIVFFFLFFSFYLAKAKNPKYILWLSPIIIYAALLSGSRGAVGFTLILLTAFIVSEYRLIMRNPKPIINGFAALTVFIGINFGMNDFLGIVEKTALAFDNFMVRVDASQEESEGRLTNDLKQVFIREFDYRYTGVGLGSTYQGAKVLFGSSVIVQQTPLEGELFRIIVEGGMFFLLFRWLFLIIIFSYLDIPLFLKIVLFLFMCVFSQNVFHIYNATYFAIGLILLNQAYYKKASVTAVQ